MSRSSQGHPLLLEPRPGTLGTCWGQASPQDEAPPSHLSSRQNGHSSGPNTGFSVALAGHPSSLGFNSSIYRMWIQCVNTHLMLGMVHATLTKCELLQMRQARTGAGLCRCGSSGQQTALGQVSSGHPRQSVGRKASPSASSRSFSSLPLTRPGLPGTWVTPGLQMRLPSVPSALWISKFLQHFLNAGYTKGIHQGAAWKLQDSIGNQPRRGGDRWPC